jgi:hypothetical protein
MAFLPDSLKAIIDALQEVVPKVVLPEQVQHTGKMSI